MKESEHAKIHVWLYKNHGSPSRCVNRKCPQTSNQIDWALKKGKTHDYKPENYQGMCRKCHSAYDHKWSNYPLIERPSKMVRLSLKDYDTVRQIAFRVHKPMITVLENIIATRSKTVWEL